MKKIILSIIALAAASTGAVAQTGNVTTTEFIVNSGTAPVLLTGSTKATGTLTLNAVPSPGDVITLGTFTYTYKSAISGTNQILIGSLANTITNTVNAIVSSGSTANYDTSGTNTSGTASASGNTITVTAYTAGTAGNSVATTGSFASSNNSWGAATLTGGAVASGTDTLYVLPANGGSYVLTAADILYLSGTLSSTPSVAIQSGTTASAGSPTVLTGTVAISGSTANNVTHIVASTSPLPVVVTGTNATPIQLKVPTAGGATSPLEVKVFIKGYWLTLP
ncbi:MAG TPA: hypothetical protein VG733_12875 [Chthoniobacteraceae bacterium]|nr:hypothetical protein [Chthoniobacteraceae bacterium]